MSGLSSLLMARGKTLITNNQTPINTQQPMTEYPNGNNTAGLCLVIEYWVLVINWSLVIGDWLFMSSRDKP